MIDGFFGNAGEEAENTTLAYAGKGIWNADHPIERPFRKLVRKVE